MKRLATEHPIVVVPVDVVDVLGVVGVTPKVCNVPSVPPPFEFSNRLYFIRGRYPASISHQVYSFGNKVTALYTKP